MATSPLGSLLPLLPLGLVAGLLSGLLGIGGGLIFSPLLLLVGLPPHQALATSTLVMVPLMVRALQVPIRLAIRFSTLAVLASASTASVGFLGDGRADPAIALVLGGTAAVAAQWSGARLNRISEDRLAWLLRSVTLVLLIDSSRRALTLALAG